MSIQMIDILYSDNPSKYISDIKKMSKEEFEFIISESVNAEFLNSISEQDIYSLLYKMSKEKSLHLCDKILSLTGLIYSDLIVRYIINRVFKYSEIKDFKRLIYVLDFNLLFIATSNQEEERNLVEKLKIKFENISINAMETKITVYSKYFDRVDKNKSSKKQLPILLKFEYIPKEIVNRINEINRTNFFFELNLIDELNLNYIFKNLYSINYIPEMVFFNKDIQSELGNKEIFVLEYMKEKNPNNIYFNFFAEHQNFIDLYKLDSFYIDNEYIIFCFGKEDTKEIKVPIKYYLNNKINSVSKAVSEKIIEHFLFNCPEELTPDYLDFYHRNCFNSKKRHKAIYCHKFARVFDIKKHNKKLLSLFSCLPATIVIEILNKNDFSESDMEKIFTPVFPYSSLHYNNWKIKIEQNIKNKGIV